MHCAEMYITRDPIPLAAIQAYDRVYMLSFCIATAENVVNDVGVITVGRQFDVHEEAGYPPIHRRYPLPDGFRTSL